MEHEHHSKSGQSVVDLLDLNEIAAAQKLQLDVSALRETMDDLADDLDMGERVERLESHGNHRICLEAKSVLMIPFSFDNLDSLKQESPLDIAFDLKSREIAGNPLWESEELPEDACEFREHFQKLLGGGEAGERAEKSVLRLRMPDQTRINLTHGARIWVREKKKKMEGKI